MCQVYMHLSVFHLGMDDAQIRPRIGRVPQKVIMSGVEVEVLHYCQLHDDVVW